MDIKSYIEQHEGRFLNELFSLIRIRARPAGTACGTADRPAPYPWRLREQFALARVSTVHRGQRAFARIPREQLARAIVSTAASRTTRINACPAGTACGTASIPTTYPWR